jgi:sulfite exporter TauE/SafE
MQTQKAIAPSCSLVENLKPPHPHKETKQPNNTKNIKPKEKLCKAPKNVSLKCIKSLFAIKPNEKICMSLIPEISNPFLGAFAGGLLYGLGVCTASCLPVLASYIAGVGSDFKKSVKITAIFNSGRIVAYALIGAVVGLFGGLLRFFVSDTAISPFQVYSSIAFGAVTIAIGGWLIWKARKPSCDCNIQGDATVTAGKVSRFGVDFGAFTLGLTRGLVICPPLIALLLYALPFSNPLGSVGIAVLFGLGTAISPMLLLGGVTGWLLNKAPLFRKWVAIAGGVVLIVLGIIAILGSTSQVT